MTIGKFSYFGIFNQYSRKNPNFFLNLVFLSRASPVDATYKGVAPCALMWLAPRCHLSCHIDWVTPHELRLLTWRDLVMPMELTWLAHQKGPDLSSLSSFLLSSIAVAQLAILVISHPYKALVALNRLHELVSGSRWVHAFFTASFDCISKFSVWMNSYGRISKLT
jgi:hypothetical protein